ncbi:membrane-associated kinase regulator 5-like, partial [Salvia hispanica]|uniref:membrane-associated kinase regulator 5-like n=1 Tax=Salvia hispanica TaxID=49212 RepID=UPI002008EF9D
SPVTILRSAPKFQVFMLGFRKSSRSDTKAKSSKLDRSNSLRSKMMRQNFDYEEKSVPKYLKLIRPFYVKISNKVKSTDSATPSSSPVNLIGSFKIVTRNLGKSRSASVGVAPPSIRRRDDSLLEQNDGIQGAILHCKKFFNSSSQDYSRLFRATSDPSHETLRAASRNSFEEQKRCSI